jgi:DNA end-binding protein Ku
MYFVDELHKERDVTPAKTAKPQKKELDLAKQLIETLAAPFKPEQFHDDYRRNVERLIQAKQKGRKVTPIKQPKKAPVIDLMQALQKSLKGKKAARVA